MLKGSLSRTPHKGQTMDFDIFDRQLRKAYNQAHSAFTLDECKTVFTEYFNEHQSYTGSEHPPLKTDKVIEIINQIDGGGMFEPGDYSLMINSYFNTDFRNCDRNICHFFSGKVREMRYFEAILTNRG